MPHIPTAHFAGRSAFRSAKLSPDGEKLGYLRRHDGRSELIVVAIEPFGVLQRFTVPEDTDIAWYRWAGSDKIVISVTGMGEYMREEVRFSRLLLAFPETGESEFLFKGTKGINGDDLIFIADDGSYLLSAQQRSIYDYPSVYRHELTLDGKYTKVQDEIDGVWDWYADDAGVIRMGMGWRNRRLRVYYRPDADSKLDLIAKLKKDDEEDRFWDVAQIVSGSDTGYVLDEDEDGKVGLRLFDYSKREVIDTVYEHPDWDLDGALLRKGKPVAAFYTDDRRRAHWFDEDFAKLYSGLGKALGDIGIWVTSRSENDERMLIWAGSESDPGVLYIYTPATKRLDQFAEFRPDLDFKALVKPKPVTYSARDGTEIRAYLTLPSGREPKGLPLIILPHGGPYGVRDQLEYNDEVQLLANRGYAVLQPNYRGSGGYGNAFFDLGAGQIGRGMQDDLDDAMDWAVAEGIADPARVCVVGSSYGGYAALWSVIRNPERYRCAASWAGVTDWDMILKYDRRYFSREGGKKWAARVRGDEDFDLDTVSPYRQAGRLNRPVLLAHGTKDSNVPFRQFKKFSSAAERAPMPPTTLEIKDEGHSFSKKENEQKWYDALVAFLAEHNPAD